MSKGRKSRDIDEETSALVKSYKIPRKEKEKETKGLIREIPFDSREYQEDILPHLKQNYYQRADSEKNYQYVHCYLIKNALATAQIEARRKQLKAVNLYTDKDVAISYAFLEVRTLEEAFLVCREGLPCGNRIFGCLGQAQMGVYLSRYSDVLTAAPTIPGTSGIIVIFKIIKGRSKLVPLQSSHLEPSPNFDSHIAKISSSDLQNASPLKIFEASQIYLYEYEDTELSVNVRGICPTAVVTYDYGSLMSRPKELSVWNGSLHCGNRIAIQKVQLMTGLGKMKPYSLGKSLHIKKITNYQCVMDWQPIMEISSDVIQPTMYKKREVRLSNGMCASLFRLVNERNDELKTFIGRLARHSAVALATLRGDTMLLLIPTGELSDHIGIPRYSDACNTLHCVVIGYRSCVTGLSYTRDPYDCSTVHYGMPSSGCRLNLSKLHEENQRNITSADLASKAKESLESSAGRTPILGQSPVTASPRAHPQLIRAQHSSSSILPPPLVPNVAMGNVAFASHAQSLNWRAPPPLLPAPTISIPNATSQGPSTPNSSAAPPELPASSKAPPVASASQACRDDEDLRLLMVQNANNSATKATKPSSESVNLKKPIVSEINNSASLFDPRLARLLRLVENDSPSPSQAVSLSSSIQNSLSSDALNGSSAVTVNCPDIDHLAEEDMLLSPDARMTPVNISSESAKGVAVQQARKSGTRKSNTEQRSAEQSSWAAELSHRLSESAALRAKELFLSNIEKAIVSGINLSAPIVPQPILDAAEEAPPRDFESPDNVQRSESPPSNESSADSSTLPPFINFDECESNMNRLIIDDTEACSTSRQLEGRPPVIVNVDRAKELLQQAVEQFDDSIYFETSADDYKFESYVEDEDVDSLNGDGVLMPDDLIFLKTPAEDVEMTLNHFYHKHRENKANWCMKVHSQMILKLADSKKNLDPSSAAHERVTKILILLTRFRNLGRVELLPRHACDSASRASKDYLNCLSKIKDENADKRCILLSNLNPNSSAAKEYTAAGILVLNVQSFKERFLSKYN